MTKSNCGIVALLVVAALVGQAQANDSSVELAVGGLTFTKSTSVSLESEDLLITPAEITVKYQFLNRDPAPVTLTIGFPLPDIDLSDPDLIYAFPTDNAENLVDFKTKVNGKPVSFKQYQRAMLGAQDVTQTVKAAGLPIFPIGNHDPLSAIDAATKKNLLDAGLLVRAGTGADGSPLFQPAWMVRTVFVRQQTFPPGRPVLVEHHYRTSIGTGSDTVLRKALRESAGLRAEWLKYQKQYCLGPSFLQSVDLMAGIGKANINKVREQRIAYVLKTGANWAGPIKDFRLRVDPGGPNRLLSFCADGEKELVGRSVQVRAKDFTPHADLKILIVSKAD